MSQASLDYPQSASPSSRWAPVLIKRVSWTLMQTQLYGNLQGHVCCQSPSALQHCGAAPCLPSRLGEAVQEDVPKHGSLSSEGKGYKQSSSWQRDYGTTAEMSTRTHGRWDGARAALQWPEEQAVAKTQLVSHETSLQSWRWQQWAGHCAGLDGWMSSTEGLMKYWYLHRDLGPCQCPVPTSLCIPTHPMYCGLCLTLGPHLPSLLGLWGRKEELSFPLSFSVFVKNFFWKNVNELI